MQLGLDKINAYVLNAQCGETVPLSVTDVSGSVVFNLAASARCVDVMVTNAGSKTAFIAFGVGATTATVPATNGTVKATPILAGAIYTFQKNSSTATECNTCAAICGAADTTTLYFTAIQGS